MYNFEDWVLNVHTFSFTAINKKSTIESLWCFTLLKVCTETIKVVKYHELEIKKPNFWLTRNIYTRGNDQLEIFVISCSIKLSLYDITYDTKDSIKRVTFNVKQYL